MTHEWLEKLKWKVIDSILGLARTKSQQRLFATFIEIAFSLLRNFGRLAGVALHLWMVSIAYQRTGLIGASLTLLLPVLSEIYWLLKLFGETNYIFHLYLCLVILSGALTYFSKQLTPVRFAFSYNWQKKALMLPGKYQRL